jgi:hypothetical protein
MLVGIYSLKEYIIIIIIIIIILETVCFYGVQIGKSCLLHFVY